MTYGAMDDYAPAESGLRDMLVRHAMRAGGLVVLALSGAFVASLATWNVNDPSLSYAAETPVANLLGAPGAAVADIAMQFLGFGTIGLLVPLAVLGWGLVRLRPPLRPLRQLGALFAGIVLMSAALGSLPVIGGWPLPTGLGGAAGDLVLGVPERLLGGELSGGLYAALAVVFGGLAAGLLWSACLRRQRPDAGRRRGSRPDDDAAADETEERESLSRSGLQLAVGVVAHWMLALRAGLRRRFARVGSAAGRTDAGRRAPARAPAPAPARAPDQARPIKAREPRQEPRFQAIVPADPLDRYRKSAAPVTAAVEPADEADDDGWDDLPLPDEHLAMTAEPLAATEPARPQSANPQSANPQSARAQPTRQPPTLRIPASWRFGRKAAAQAEAEAGPAPASGGEAEHDIQPVAAASRPAPLVVPPRAAAPSRPAVLSQHPDQRAAQPQEPRPTLRPGPRLVRDAEPPARAAGGFTLPPLDLLTAPQHRRRDATLDPGALEQNARLLEGVLEDFGVRGEIINVRPGPVVTLYELEPAPGIKSSRVISLADDIARSMSAIAARVAVIPGKNAIGIELPNASRETVYLRELLASGEFDGTKARLALGLGKTIGGESVIADLAKMPHLLVAGTTGSGKSVAINTMILALVYRLTPAECRLIMIDPKMLELSVYDGIPHLLTPVVTDPKKAVVALKWTVREMEDRYKKMSKLGVRNIDGFNQRVDLAARKGETLSRTVQTGFDQASGEPLFETEALDLEPMPYIVVIIDEMADLMMVAGKEIEGAVQRLAQMARAAGIHVIMATQRPSVDVITGTIKANFPTRISFQVTSKIDSRTILGEQGGEQLLGQGDMLYMAGGGRIQRVHGPFVSDEEVEDIVAHLKAQGSPDYLDSITDEDEGEGGGGMDAFAGGLEESGDLYDQAVAVVLRDRKASTSYIQRRLSIGYNRAASLIEKMEKEGIVGSANHAGKREILVGEDAA